MFYGVNCIFYFVTGLYKRSSRHIRSSARSDGRLPRCLDEHRSHLRRTETVHQCYTDGKWQIAFLKSTLPLFVYFL